MQTESSDGRPSRLFSTSSSPFSVCWRMMLYTDVRVQWWQTESYVSSSMSMINVMMRVSVFESIRFKSCFRNSTEEKETLGCENHCVMCVSCLYLLLYRLLYHVMSLMNRSSGVICRMRHVYLDECVKLALPPSVDKLTWTYLDLYYNNKNYNNKKKLRRINLFYNKNINLKIDSNTCMGR